MDYNYNRRQEEVFQNNATPVSISQVSILMRNLEEKRKETKATTHPNFESFFEYVKRFNNFQESDTVQLLQEKLEDFRDNLNLFQLSSITNLNPRDVDELRSVIPDTENANDTEIRQLIQLLERNRKIEL